MARQYSAFLIPMASCLIFAGSAHAASSYQINTVSPSSHSFIQVAKKGLSDEEKKKIAKGAENFINTMGKRATGFLGATNMSQAQKEKEFRKLLKTSFDMTTIGRFSLGRYWNASTAVQRKEYLRLFESMVVEVYAQRFNDYQGQTLEVRGSRPEGKSDTVVNSFIVDNSGNEFRVDWRVRYKKGVYKVVDVIIEGVSMSVTQRSDFSSVIQRGGGDVQVLLAHLKTE